MGKGAMNFQFSLNPEIFIPLGFDPLGAFPVKVESAFMEPILSCDQT
jgi:hypothetical protein